MDSQIEINRLIVSLFIATLFRALSQHPAELFPEVGTYRSSPILGTLTGEF